MFLLDFEILKFFFSYFKKLYFTRSLCIHLLFKPFFLKLEKFFSSAKYLNLPSVNGVSRTRETENHVL